MDESNRGARRRHGAELKARVLEQCEQPGASVARVALAHGLNANLVHKWRQRGRCRVDAGLVAAAESFVPVTLTAPTTSPVADIRIEVRRGVTAVSVRWPVSAAADCAAWLREWLA